MNDIKPSKEICVDYIPKDGRLCKRCIHYEHCPMEFLCKTLERMMEQYGVDYWDQITRRSEE